MAYTPLASVTTGDLWTASDHNTFIKDNFSAGVPDIFSGPGQLVYGTAADVAAALAAGSAYQGLRMNSAGAAPEWADGVTKIGPTQVASNSASITFTGLGSPFRWFELWMSGVVPQTDNTNLQLEIGTGAGPSWVGSGYKYRIPNMDDTTGSTSYASTNSSAAALWPIGQNLGNSAGESFNGIVRLLNLTDALVKLITTEIVSYNANVKMNTGGVGMNTGTTAVTALRVTMSSGNISVGNFALYGRR